MWEQEDAQETLPVRLREQGRPRADPLERVELRVVSGHLLRGVSKVSENSENPTRLEVIWAPWRMQYILEPKTDGCFLCEAVASGDDRGNFVLERRERCFSIFNRFPYNNGHMLVAPISHKADLTDLDDAELDELIHLTRDTERLLARSIAPHGFNIGINLGRCAGAGVPGHLHVHIVPRWNGDTNFMPVTGNAKILVQSLEALYDLLKENLGSKEGG